MPVAGPEQAPTLSKGQMSTDKADFSDIYTQPDPRSYHSTLGALDYQIPEHGCQIFEVLLDELRSDGGTPAVLDVCCSYGINAALINHELTLTEFQEHYRTAGELSRSELIARDRAFFAERRRPDPVEVTGLDASRPALDYAIEAGLLTDGLSADLENGGLEDADRDRIRDVDLVTVTGGIGYIGGPTFDRILDAMDEPPWVAALSLRWVDFEPVAQAFGRHGLVTEQIDDLVVPQRRFAADEERFVLDELAARGLEPTDVENAGQHAADVYIARPAADASRMPAEEMLAAVL